MTNRGMDRFAEASLLVVALGLFVQFGVVSEAEAIDFDRRGVAELDAAYAEGFEQDLRPGDYLTGEGGELEYDAERSLQGERSIVVGDGTPRIFLEIPRSEFEGRRINLRIWYRADGTDVVGRLVWANRTLDSLQDDVLSLGAARLSPTGRATSDGWIELETGPVDWEFAAAGGPIGLLISDSQYSRRGMRPNDELDARVDAVEIEDLGSAAVPDRSCNLPEENARCGPRGICWLGRCVDAAAALGSIPSEGFREAYLQRRGFLIEETLAIRRTRPQLETFHQILDGLRDATPKSFWTRIVSAWERLRDGHASPPSGKTIQATSPQGICLGPGRADLLPEEREAPVPMVFEPGSSSLEPGDVLTRIDGLEVDAWKHAARRYLYYNGDPDGREALQVNDVLRAAVQTGATVEFTRCASDGDPPLEACSPSETTSVEIDFAETVGAEVWEGGETDALDEETGRYCDFRFDSLRPDDEGIGSGAVYFSELDSGTVRAEYFDMPQPRSRDGEPLASWEEGWSTNLSDEPDQIMVDQRLGFGGGFEAVHFLGDLFLKAASSVREIGFPWYGSTLGADQMQGLRECLDGQESDACGGLFVSGVDDNDPTTQLGEQARLALVTANAVSGNDFFAKYLTFREAETRIFGYAPTVGAFGAVRSFSGLPGESQAPSYQYHDTRFVSADQGLSQSRFSSGQGVDPDEIVYQRQSDARRGVDSIISAAEAWLDDSGSDE